MQSLNASLATSCVQQSSINKYLDFLLSMNIALFCVSHVSCLNNMSLDGSQLHDYTSASLESDAVCSLNITAATAPMSNTGTKSKIVQNFGPSVFD